MIDITMLSDQYSVRRLDDSDADDILDFSGKTRCTIGTAAPKHPKSRF